MMSFGTDCEGICLCHYGAIYMTIDLRSSSGDDTVQSRTLELG